MSKKTNRELAIKIGAVLFVVSLVIGVAYSFISKNSAGSSGSASSLNAAIFIPIYAAVIIPLIAKKDRSKEQLDPKRMLIGILVGVTSLMMLLTLAFLFAR